MQIALDQRFDLPVFGCTYEAINSMWDLVHSWAVCKLFFVKSLSLSLKTNWMNEWFSSNRRLRYAHRITGSPGGKHCKSLQRNVWRGAVSPFKSSVFGQRMRHFAVILWEAEVTNAGALIVSFCGINAMKSIDKHSLLRKVDCEIYRMVSQYIVLTYQV